MHTGISTTYMDMTLRSPVIVGSCPMTANVATVRDLAIAGAGAVVLPSLDTCPTDRTVTSDRLASYLNTIANMKRCVGIPIIASLEWQPMMDVSSVAAKMERRGIDAIECFVGMDVESSHLHETDACCECRYEADVLRIASELRSAIAVPIAIKLLPFCSDLSGLIDRLAQIGIAGVTLFGTEREWILQGGKLVQSPRWALTDAGLLQVTISGLVRASTGQSSTGQSSTGQSSTGQSGDDRSKDARPAPSLAASGGIASDLDVIKTIVAGARVTVVTSEIYRSGPDAISHMLDGLTQYLSRSGFASLDSFRETTVPSATNDRV